jgi:DNA-binding CsgD family transcriptional regulator
MALGRTGSGLLLLDTDWNPVACNAQAAEILVFPNSPGKIKKWNVFLGDRVRSSLVDRQSREAPEFVKEFRSGRRRYVCRAFQLQYHGNDAQPVVAVLLERSSSATTALSEITERFDLTGRERESVELLLQGLTTKEIAARMSISPNTVKAFLRLVMLKLGVSTRSGIVGRIAGS